ncbi:MAG: class I SAM-dependent methyltransferase [Flavobacteriaceae bacterium]|nr:class I SAM-dependent methyltransferase [Flavobacteriaceae bacterium]
MIKKFQKLKHLAEVSLTQNNRLEEIQNYSFGPAILSSIKATKQKSYPENLVSAFQEMENYRIQLLNNTELIDFGIFEKDLKTPISEICKKAATPKIWCEFFFLLAYNSNSSKILEIGTNLGVSGQYYLKALQLNASNKETIQFTTIEGVADLCKVAQNRFGAMSENVNTFQVICGLYDDVLPAIIAQKTQYDIYFIDGNHKFEPTVNYYNMLKRNISKKAIFIFDDINWSAEMAKAWQTILKSDYSYSIDFYKLGIVVIDNESPTVFRRNFKSYLSF